MSKQRYYSKIEISLPGDYARSNENVKNDIAEGYDVDPDDVMVTRKLYPFRYPRVIKTDSNGKISRYNADITLGL